MNFAIIIVLLVTAVIPEVWTKDKIVVGRLKEEIFGKNPLRQNYRKNVLCDIFIKTAYSIFSSASV